MSIAAQIIMLIGSAIAVLAGVGLLRFETSYARLHAAGKASPVAFLITAVGAAMILGWPAIALLVIAAAAMIITLPVGVHLLFRAVHRTPTSQRLDVDELRQATNTP